MLKANTLQLLYINNSMLPMANDKRHPRPWRLKNFVILGGGWSRSLVKKEYIITNKVIQEQIQ